MTEVFTTKASQDEIAQYARLMARHIPPRPVLRNSIHAFIVGGTICAIGQLVLATLLRSRIPEQQAIGYTSGLMVVLGSVLTAVGYYDEIGRVGGMGSALPITGFANSIVAPAMEFKREGYVLGVAAKMFNVAGPVIVYGLVTAAIVTLIRMV